MINQQAPEKPVQGDGLTIDVHSVFFTLQGEGPYSGVRSVFLRLAGCNLQCPGCDTEYTKGRQEMHISDIVTKVMATGAPDKVGLVVITGGEPLRQPVGLLCVTLCLAGYMVQIESNGTARPDKHLEALLREAPFMAKLIVSPKTANIHPLCNELACAFKYVVDHRYIDPEDGLPTCALEHSKGRGVARPRHGAPVFLSPYDNGLAPGLDPELNNFHNRAAVAASALRYGYVACVQLHKLLDLP